MIRWTHWHTEPLLIGGILAVAWIYCLSIGPYRNARYTFPKKESVYFGLGIFSFYLAVGSPLDALGENFLFSAHMAQHNILMYVTPLLLIVGLPGWLIDDTLNRYGWLRIATKFLVHPIVAGVCFTLVFSLWHIPYLYEWALHDKAMHAFEHLSMLFVSLQIWWCISGRPRRSLSCAMEGRLFSSFS